MSETERSTVESSHPGGRLFVFKEREHPDGGAPRTIAFTEVQIKPRTYEELEAAKLHAAVTIQLEMFNGRIVDTDVVGIDLDNNRYAHFTATLVSRFTSKAIGLVRGGWLPSALAATRISAVVLPDRNVLNEIVGRFDGGASVGRDPDFLDLFANEPIKINPLLFALEGNSRSIPEPAAAEAQLAESIAKLRSALPAADIMVGPQSLDGLLGLINDTKPGIVRKQAFLRRLAPLLASQVARRDVDTRWEMALSIADELGIPRQSLVVLAVLSTIVNGRGSCPARRLLKFHARYSDADAYNALSDLRALDVLLHCLALFPESDTQLCTADRNLALFWVGIGAFDIERSDAGIRYNLNPHEALLPSPYRERWMTNANGVGT